MDPVASLSSEVAAAASELAGNGRSPGQKLDRPPRPEFGDYSSNAAMLLAPVLGEPPRAVAERLGDALGERLGSAVERVEIAGPGFLNLFMTDAWYLDSLAGSLEAGEDYGRGADGLRLNVEFVSANPTGPITLASGRHAAYGDSLCRILELAGNEVEREYYINDAGSQVRKFGEAIQARARGEEPDEYLGEYVTELAKRIEGAAEADPEELAQRGIELVLDDVRATFARFRVRMDRFFSENDLHQSGAVEAALERLDRDLRARGRPLAAHHRLRRRQGPGAAPLGRRVHLLRHRHRLPPGQAGTGLRPRDQRLGRRPPRLRPPHEGALAGARASPSGWS